MQLEQHGDHPEIKRKVDHWIDFKKENDRKAFISNALQKGFEVVKELQNDQDEFRYSVNIVREDVTVLSEVNMYVWELVELATENNGRYGGWGCPIAE